MEVYDQLRAKTAHIEDKIKAAQAAISEIETRKAGDVPARIVKLEEQLKKIDDYLLKIEAFRQLAEKNLESKNVLTIEAPPDYRVNLNRLRQWAMLIDPTATDDPYAQRVYITAQCDLCFLRKKQAEFSQRLEELRGDENVGFGEEIHRLEEEITAAVAESQEIYTSEEMLSFSRQVEEANRQHWYETAPLNYSDPAQVTVAVSPGACAAPLFVPQEHRGAIKTLFGRFYDDGGSRVLLPVELPTSREFAMSIVCAPSRGKQLDRGIQNFLLSLIEKYPAGQNTLYVLDAVRFSSAPLGSLRRLEGSFALAPSPRNPEQLTAILEQIVATFPDLDDTLDLCDSVAEYNETAEADKRLPRTTLVLYGWPNAYEGRDKEYLQRIMTNYERYGISFICVTYQSNQNKAVPEGSALPEYAMQNAVHIRMLPKETTIQIGEEPLRRFTWYTFSDVLSDSYVEDVMSRKIERQTQGNEYPKRYDCVHMPTYSRDYKKIELPFGIDSKDQVHSVSFENENFAAYLVGASRSGKSTLLHTLVTGIIRNYHPDNVELWLADFKQLEFKKYMDHCPPHVKYILLDESTELVYDLIDKLTDKMMERQRLFARLGKERLDQIDPTSLDEPVPVIFVILDEFSIMSQAIAESESYKLRLQNLLAKGAALGIKFLFSSQTFTTGVSGLTQTARAQIQQRIAMKGTREEIGETLELSANLKTEQVRNWMDALPPHYALVKYRVSADQLPQVIRTLVMYIPDYSVRDRLIETIRENMRPVDRYTPTDLTTYMDKHPVMVDGNTYRAFPEKGFAEKIESVRKDSGADLSGDEMFMSFGTPRLMEPMKLTALSNETRENMLLIARSAEQSCAASVLLSAIKTFSLQGGRIQIWAYGKNRLYRAYRDSHWIRYDVSEGISKICTAIAELKEKIETKESGKELIVLLGMEQICNDFDLIDFSGGMPRKGASVNAKQYEALSEEEIDQFNEVKYLNERFRDEYEIEQLEDSWLEEGKSSEEITAEVDRLYEEFLSKVGTDFHANSPGGGSDAVEVLQVGGQEGGDTAYNALEDFKYIVKQGSRLGYHFVLYLNDLSDLRMTQLQQNLFRHKLVFQISPDDSVALFASRVASKLPEHICQYSDSLEQFSLRPYIHEGVSWDGWDIDPNGEATNSMFS